MVTRPGILLFFLAAVAVAAGGLFYGLRTRASSERMRAQQEFLEMRVSLLEEENVRLEGLVDRLERAGVVDDPETVIRRDLEAVTGELRGIDGERRIRYKIVTREGVVDLVHEKVRGRPADVDARVSRLRAWEAMGWIEEAPDWDRLVLRLLGGEASAFYDEDAGVLHVARGTALEEAVERALLVHEMTYALLDQRYDLESYFKGSPDLLWRDSDAELARRAVAVGDASLTALRYNSQFGSPLITADKNLGEFGAFAVLAGPSDDASPRVPAALAKAAAFPYSAGRAFCAALSPDGDYAAIDGAYARAPSSTAEILDPDLYRSRTFQPRRYDWREDVMSLDGCEILWSDVAGQWGCYLLLGSYLDGEIARTASEGWQGDRFLVYIDHDEEVPTEEVLWVSAWSDATTAGAFAEALGSALKIRYALQEPVAGKYDGERFLSLEVDEKTAEVVFVDAGSAKRRGKMLGRVP